MTPNEALRNAILRRKILVSQFATGKLVELLRVFDEIDKEIRGVVRESGDLSRMATWELDALLEDIKRFNEEANWEVKKRTDEANAELVSAEIAFIIALLSQYGVVNGVETQAVLDAAKAMAVDGLLPDEIMDSISALRDKTASQAIRRAFVEGSTATDVITDLYGTTSNNHNGSMTRLNQRSIDVMGRLSMGDYENIAREQVYKANPQLVYGVQWVATLDGNTCIACGALDGQIWRLDEPHPEPPYHGGCRCILAPILLGEKAPDIWTFSDWLANQDAETQKEVLGPSRYSMYKQGTPFKSFSVDGRIKTLSELGFKK